MSKQLHRVDYTVEVVLPITKMAPGHVNPVQSRGQRPSSGTVWLQMTDGCYYYSLPGETNRAPSCLVREEVEASKGLERYYRNGSDNGVPEPEWGISNLAAMLPSYSSEST